MLILQLALVCLAAFVSSFGVLWLAIMCSLRLMRWAIYE